MVSSILNLQTLLVSDGVDWHWHWVLLHTCGCGWV